MNEFLMANWVEVGFGLLMIVIALIFILACLCYQEAKREFEEEQKTKELTEKEIEELQKMMPKLPEDK